MLTTNINTEDRLINGQMGTVKHIEIRDNEVRTMYGSRYSRMDYVKFVEDSL